MTEFKANFKSVKSDLGGSLPGQLIFCIPGKDGGYYLVAAEQVAANTIRFTFTPSQKEMPAVDPVDITLPNATGAGLTTAQINALDGMFKVCAFTKPDVSAEYNAFKTAFGIGGGEEPDIPDVPDEPDVPEKTLTSISATYSGGSVTAGTAVNDLTGIVVTAHYSDGTSETVTGYTLSGTIAEGSNTINVSYGGKTTTFVVTGTTESGGDDSEPFVNLIDGMTFVNTGYSGSYVASGLAADKYVNETDITFEAGVTYYAYAPFTVSNAPSAKVFANDGSGAYTDSGVTATRQSYYKNGNYDEWGKEKEDTPYMVADGIYLIKNVFTPSETITGKLSYGNKCAYKSYPDYMYLFTREYNPLKDSLE